MLAVFRFLPGTAGSSHGVCGVFDDSNQPMMLFEQQTGSDGFAFLYRPQSTANWLRTGLHLTDGQWHTAVGWLIGVRQYLSIDGSPPFEQDATSGAPLGTLDRGFELGGIYRSSITNFGDVEIALFAFSTPTNLSLRLGQSLSANPWQIFEADTTYLFPATGGGGDEAVITTRALSDGISVTDADDELCLRARQLADTLSVSDFAAMIRSRARLRADELLLTDSLPESRRTLIRSVQDSIAATDSATPLRTRLRSLLDVLESVDSLVVSGQTGAVITSRVLSDNASITDVFDALSLRYRVIQDELSVLDTLVLGAGGKKRILEDVLSVTDASLRYLLAVRLSQSLVTASDDLALGRVLGRTAQDETSLSDETSGKRALGRSAEDTILSDDSSSQRRLRDRVTQDEIDAVDAVIANYITEIFNSLVLHGLEIRDIVVGLEDLNIVTDISQEIG